MNLDNPAFRLVSLLEEGKSIDPNYNCQKAWAKLLDVPVHSPSLYSRIGKIMELPEQIVAAIKSAHPDEPDTWSHWTSQLQKAFQNQALNQTWHSFISHIDNHTIIYLKMHSRHLQMHSSQKTLSQDELTKARTELTKILSALLKSDNLEASVKSSLCRNIRKLIIAIEEYKLTGSIGILDSIEILYGHSAFDPKYNKEIKNNAIFKNLSSIVSTLADSMAISLGLPAISDTLKALIFSEA